MISLMALFVPPVHAFIYILSSPEPKAYSRARLRHPSVRPHFRTRISLGSVGQSCSNFMYSITGVVTSLNSCRIRSVTSELCTLEGRLNFQLTYGISKISWPILIEFYIYLQWGGGKAAFRFWSTVLIESAPKLKSSFPPSH